MSTCRQKHYTEYLEDRHAEMLKASIWMTLVILSFRTTFSVKGGHNIINTYYRNLPSVVRRNLHVTVIRYMEQDCVCPSHVKCDIVPVSLTSEVILPSYQHFLEREHHTRASRAKESETLSQYGKTILMLILAIVNGYYSPYSPQSITEEEQRCLYGNVFAHAEKEFFKHRLQAKFPKISKENVETALVFLEKQKIANCPCLIHTESRGYDWVVFRRQPDRIPTLYYDVEKTETKEDEEEDDDYCSVEPVDNDETEEDTQDICEIDPDVTGAASSTNEDLTKGLDETPTESGPGDASTQHSRDQDHTYSHKQKTPDEEEVMDSEDSDEKQSIMCAVISKRSNYVCFKPLMYYNRQLDRNYYYKYFKPYTFD